MRNWFRVKRIAQLSKKASDSAETDVNQNNPQHFLLESLHIHAGAVNDLGSIETFLKSILCLCSGRHS